MNEYLIEPLLLGRRAGSFAISQGAWTTIRWLSWPIKLHTMARAPA